LKQPNRWKKALPCLRWEVYPSRLSTNVCS